MVKMGVEEYKLSDEGLKISQERIEERQLEKAEMLRYSVIPGGDRVCETRGKHSQWKACGETFLSKRNLYQRNNKSIFVVDK